VQPSPAQHICTISSVEGLFGSRLDDSTVAVENGISFAI
jgi:hypothetical protein